MEKTKIFALTVTLAVLALVAVAGAAYAQTLSVPTQVPSTGIWQAPHAGSPATGFSGGFGCPWLNGNAAGIGSQSGYVAQPRVGMRGMMGRVGW